MVMVGTRKPGDRFETGRAVLYAIVDDPDALHDRAKAAGAAIVMELTDQPYGSRDFAAEDPEGNVWSLRDLRSICRVALGLLQIVARMTARPAHPTLSPRGYAYFSYGTWRFS